MKRLFSYCVQFDTGAAPNPFGGVCTLVICKPAIRRVAKVGDWIVGTGSTRAGLAGKVIYAMEVSEVLTMQEYDERCKKQWKGKIPDLRSKRYEDKVGDCIYDFSTSVPTLRRGVHAEGNRKTDLGGVNALISTNFYYFGEKAEPLPPGLNKIVKQGQAHKSDANQGYFDDFVKWIEEFTARKNQVWGQPSLLLSFEDESEIASCAMRDKLADEEDEIVEGD